MMSQLKCLGFNSQLIFNSAISASVFFHRNIANKKRAFFRGPLVQILSPNKIKRHCLIKHHLNDVLIKNKAAQHLKLIKTANFELIKLTKSNKSNKSNNKTNNKTNNEVNKKLTNEVSNKVNSEAAVTSSISDSISSSISDSILIEVLIRSDVAIDSTISLTISEVAVA